MVIALLPGRLLSRCPIAPPAQWHLNVLISHALLLTAVFATPGLAWCRTLPHACLCQALTGFPCPGCGMTRSVAAVARGEFQQAFAFHPGGIAFVCGLLIQLGLHGAMLARPAASTLANFCSRVLEQFTWIMLCAVWLGRVFPTLIFN